MPQTTGSTHVFDGELAGVDNMRELTEDLIGAALVVECLRVHRRVRWVIPEKMNGLEQD